MDQILRLKDTVIQFLTPQAKRRRTLPTTSNDDDEHRFRSPISEIQDKRGRAAALSHLSQKFLSPSDTKNPRKRTRAAFEEGVASASDEFDVSPDDSISQSARREEEQSVTSYSELAEEVDIEEELAEEAEEEEEEVSPDAKVQEYLKRQAELALRLEDIEKVKSTGGFHPDELFLFERFSMRSFEELLPTEWQIDFPTLPPAIFTLEPAKQFINFNHRPSSHGKIYICKRDSHLS